MNSLLSKKFKIIFIGSIIVIVVLFIVLFVSYAGSATDEIYEQYTATSDKKVSDSKQNFAKILNFLSQAGVINGTYSISAYSEMVGLETNETTGSTESGENNADSETLVNTTPNVIGDTVNIPTNYPYDDVYILASDKSSHAITIPGESKYNYLSARNNFSYRQGQMKSKFNGYQENGSTCKYMHKMLFVNYGGNWYVVLAIKDFWNLENNFVGRVVKVNCESGSFYGVIGDVKGIVCNSSGNDKTATYGHIHSQDKVGILEFFVQNGNNTPGMTEVQSALGISGNTVSIQLTDIDVLK